MLRLIEKATKQKIERMELPSKETVANRRLEKFKQKVMGIITNKDLEYLCGVIEHMESEHAVDAREIAAALAFLLQGEQPLKVVDNAPPAEKQRAENKPGRDTAGQRKETEAKIQPQMGKAQPLKKFPEIEMVRYRIEVGKLHGATPKDIVGAIANEADIESQYIGHIKLYDDFSTVDLPEGMPKELFQHLKKVRVRQQKLNISLVDNGQEGAAVQFKPSKRKPRGSAKKSPAKRASKPAAKKRRGE
jgi:ATP-dependent RNA helicase DeaD